jgi:hypothetical protein
MVTSTPDTATPQKEERWQSLDLNVYGACIRFTINDEQFFEWMSFLLPRPRFTMAARDEARHLIEYRIELDRPTRNGKERHYVYCNGERVGSAKRRDELQWLLERTVLREMARGLVAPFNLVHAAAAARDGHGILFPAHSKSGKSTLVAALTLNGYEYYSDEIGVLTSHKTLLPFPKAITLKAGGWKAISTTFPEVHDITYHPAVGDRFRHLMAPKFHAPSSPESAVPVSLVIVPKYRPEGKTELLPESRAVIMGEMAKRSMNWTVMGGPAFQALAEVLKGAQCYRLYTNDLREAVAVVDGLVEGLKASRAAAKTA